MVCFVVLLNVTFVASVNQRQLQYGFSAIEVQYFLHILHRKRLQFLSQAQAQQKSAAAIAQKIACKLPFSETVSKQSSHGYWF